ncbi:MAG: hypothetical protein JO110_27530 [Acetobacteraceae bacterium]|nr:hypothetical protein [Acetobacteraceae bacterium]
MSEKQAAMRVDSFTQRLERVLIMELPAWRLLALAAFVGGIWAATLFNWSFVTGRDAFWQFPRGTLPNSGSDMVQVLIAYLYYIQSPWHLPLFHVSALGAPSGTNVVFMDVVPLVALIGKVVHSLTGARVNPYGLYLFLCFVLPGVMMTLVLIAARIRYALAAVIAAIFTNAMPALLWRWGHIALEAQFLLIGALALYLFSLKKPAWRGLALAWIGYIILAYLINLHLFAVAGIVWLCALMQRRLNRLATSREVLATVAFTIASLLILMILCGQFSRGSGLPFSRGYGFFSMNLLSPVVPQESGLFPRAGGVIDGTGYQYEGFNYLGAGLLLASLFLLPVEARWLRQNVRRHIALLVAFAGLTAFAVSHRVFASQWLVFELPLPPYLVWALGTFRSSGRFFWLIAYAQMAVVLVLGFRRPPQPVMALCLAGAAILQLADVQPLRQQIIASIAAGPWPEQLNRGELANVVSRARQVEVVPSFQCVRDWNERSQKIRQANLDLALSTASMNVPTNTIYLSRQRSYDLSLSDFIRAPSHAPEILMAARERYCKQEQREATSDKLPGDVILLLADRPSTDEMAAEVICSPLSWARYCKRSEQRAPTAVSGIAKQQR